MADMEFKYDRMEHNFLFDILKREDVASALAYMLDYNHYNDFNTIAHKHSVEISNRDITICVIFFVGFEDEEYRVLQFRNNLQLVTFSRAIPTMCEFAELKIKFIDNLSLLFTILSLSNDYYGRILNSLKNLKT